MALKVKLAIKNACSHELLVSCCQHWVEEHKFYKLMTMRRVVSWKCQGWQFWEVWARRVAVGIVLGPERFCRAARCGVAGRSVGAPPAARGPLVFT